MKKDIRELGQGLSLELFICFFLFQGWNLFAKKALACSILYHKTFSTAGITHLVETECATRQVAIRSIVRLSTC